LGEGGWSDDGLEEPVSLAGGEDGITGPVPLWGMPVDGLAAPEGVSPAAEAAGAGMVELPGGPYELAVGAP
jgi:hypothetical protein